MVGLVSIVVSLTIWIQLLLLLEKLFLSCLSLPMLPMLQCTYSQFTFPTS